MLRLPPKQMRLFRRIQRKKYKVSDAFLSYNMQNILRFLSYASDPKCIIRCYARRKRKEQKIVLLYNQLRRVLFDKVHYKAIKTRRLNVKQWSAKIVKYLRNAYGIKEYIEEHLIQSKPVENIVIEGCDQSKTSEDVSKQMKEQLELLKTGKRTVALIAEQNEKKSEEAQNNVSSVNANNSLGLIISNARSITPEELKTVNNSSNSLQTNLETTPKKQIVSSESNENFLDNLLSKSRLTQTAEKTDDGEASEENFSEQGANSKNACLTKVKGNFLDMLINKVGAKTSLSVASNSSPSCKQLLNDEETFDSGDEFLGFDESSERTPGMLLTPLVPANRKSKNGANHAAFVSESLNEFMRKNLLDTSKDPTANTTVLGRKVRQAANIDGLVTPNSIAPHMDMPAVPETLQRLRTVAERKIYFSKNAKNHRLPIINNEAMIYKELQRKIRLQKFKCISQQTQSTSIPFTRAGWRAASYIATEFNKFYYQMLEVDNGKYTVKLNGCRGNNEEHYKPSYNSFGPSVVECNDFCKDAYISYMLKPIKTACTKLNNTPLKAILPPCPLSYKPFQKPLDDETAALLLAGGSMAVVRMPTVELEVFPEIGKPLNEIAKRYLQHILPHHDITREWAEFSVSTLQQPSSLREAELAVAAMERRKSFTFVIPYMNDRQNILVRRVVDRSEKLDASFEQAEATAHFRQDFSFRNVLKQTKDSVLEECADMLGDLINCVAISCSENSFIKNDPDNIYALNGNSTQTNEADKICAISKEKKVDITLNSGKSGAAVSQASKKQTRLL